MYGFIWLLDYLFSVLWCSAKTCKTNVMVHYVLCLLRSEAEICKRAEGGKCVAIELDIIIQKCIYMDTKDFPGFAFVAVFPNMIEMD